LICAASNVARIGDKATLRSIVSWLELRPKAEQESGIC